MTYRELVIELTHELGLPRREVRRLLRGFVAVTRRFLVAGHPVTVRGLGRLQRVVVAPRGKLNGRAVKPANVIAFKAARPFLDDMRRH